MSNGFTYLINVNVQGSSTLSKLVDMLDRINGVLHNIEGNTSRTASAMDNMANRGRNAAAGLGSSFQGLLGTIGGVGLAISSLKDTAASQGVSNAINFASGGASEGAKNIAFVRDEVERLGLPLQESLKGFKTLDAAMMGSGMSQESVRKIFKGTGTAVSAMGLTAEDSQGVFLALGQIMSKGKVSAEELRGQIGERLPGAFGIAARAMGLTTQQLDKMMNDGKIASGDFLPKFAAELEKTFAGALPTSVNSAQANFNRLSNSLYNLKIIVGEQLLPPVMKFINEYLIPGVKWIGQHIDLIGSLALTFGALRLAAFGYTSYLAIADLVTKGFTGTIWGLDAALLANPITWVVAGVIALGGAIYYAYTHSETFRGVLGGLWEVLKVGFNWWTSLYKQLWQVGTYIYTTLEPAFTVIGKLLYKSFIQPIEWVINLFKEFYGYLSDLTGITTVFNKGFDSTMMQEHFNGLIPKINDTTKAVMGLTDSYYDLNKVSLSQADWKSKLSYDKMSPVGILAKDAVSSAFGGVGGDSTGQKDSKLQSGINNITGGGSKQTTFNIHIGKLQDKIEIHVTQATEGIDRLGDEVLKKLTQVINNMQQAQAS